MYNHSFHAIPTTQLITMALYISIFCSEWAVLCKFSQFSASHLRITVPVYLKLLLIKALEIPWELKKGSRQSAYRHNEYGGPIQWGAGG